MKGHNNLIITTLDKKRLMSLFKLNNNNTSLWENVRLIAEKLGTAKTVSSKKVPSSVITMNSRVEIRNVSQGKALSIELVYPDAADAVNHKISVLSPLGAAMLGYSQGDEFVWTGKSIKSRFIIEKVLYQPEAAGDYHL
ncbi:GreA/GreB family elongation factor [Cesiribacter sp. SM1]|uniref:GreA/GreB family elongation factor n=1 Tax=Cesiribacter sp. SM1 TaxID=2861196 RepID=UPI001CD4AB08|nr:GreA/GreB family elongation factor [Cesiribacter sp. SM1]